MMVRKKYPVNPVVKQIIAETARHANHLPYELYTMVKDELERRGYYVGHVNIKRVWKLYMELVNEGYFSSDGGKPEKIPSRLDKSTAIRGLA